MGELNLAAIEARAAAVVTMPREVTCACGESGEITSFSGGGFGTDSVAICHDGVTTHILSSDDQIKAVFAQGTPIRNDTAALVARVRELEAENAKIDDLDEALRQRDREILGLRRDRDARDAQIAELEAAHDLMASQFKIMQAEKEHGWREAARMEARLERLSS